MQSSTEKKIPLFEPSITWHEVAAIQKVIESGGMLNEGPIVRQAEKMFAAMVDSKYCIMVPNGALGLYLATTDLVGTPNWIVPDYYGIFAANALHMSNKLVALADVDRKTATFQQSPEAGKLKIASTLPIHANGRLASVDDATVEDCCQAITHHTPGMLSVYSFHSTKMVTAAGGGGAVCCDRKEDYEAMYAVKDHGRPERVMDKPVTDRHARWGTNLKFLDIQAAFLIEQLKKLPERLEKFRNTSRFYKDILGSKVMWLEGEPSWRVDCLLPDPPGPQYVVEKLAKSGIQAQRFYLPTHQQKEFARQSTEFPNTNYLYQHGIYLPCSDKLTPQEIEFVCDKVKEALN